MNKSFLQFVNLAGPITARRSSVTGLLRRRGTGRTPTTTAMTSLQRIPDLFPLQGLASSPSEMQRRISSLPRILPRGGTSLQEVTDWWMAPGSGLMDQSGEHSSTGKHQSQTTGEEKTGLSARTVSSSTTGELEDGMMASTRVQTPTFASTWI